MESVLFEKKKNLIPLSDLLKQRELNLVEESTRNHFEQNSYIKQSSILVLIVLISITTESTDE